jgi:four helix bundle protein
MATTRQDLRARSFAFAARILTMYRELAAGGPHNAHMAHQLFRSASSVAAQLEEAAVYSSRQDLAAKLTIALREARECHLWLRLLATDAARQQAVGAELQEAGEFVAMLTTSVRKLRAQPSATPDS